MDSANPEPSVRGIPAFSRRQVMDWSLVLASQEIPAAILHSDEGGWLLEVAASDYPRALESIRLYRAENRRWSWQQPVPWFRATFHFGAAIVCALLVLVNWASIHRVPEFRAGGEFATKAVEAGEWWRAFTAMLLHSDGAHLLSNVTAGFVLLGLAMARYGAGVALLASYLAGAAGNAAGFYLHVQHYIGVGASGMIMGALGLISIPHAAAWSFHPRALRQLAKAAGAGILLFVLLGANPASDVVAHAGGYVAGAALGVVLNRLPSPVGEGRTLATAAWIVLAGCVLSTSWLALMHR
jgi:membrane associated rhomboid family serine protease